jgi:membrane protease YdiL (CAAX protease family)
MFGRRRKNESLGLPQSDARCRPKTWGWLATFGLALVAAVASQLPALAAVSWSHDYGFSFATLQHMTGDGVAVITLVYVSTPVQVGLLFLFARLRSSSAVEYLALTLPRKRDLPVLLLSAAVLVAASDGLSWFLGKNVVPSFQHDIYRSAASAGAQVWLWLAVVIVAPIGEEILFRGFLFRGWQRSSGDAWIAIGATAVLWAIVHVQYDPLVIGEILVAGLVLGWVRWRTRSTISTILLHSVLNAGGMAETYFRLRG